MQIVPRDYSSDILNLEKLITNIQSNVFFTIGSLIAIIALSIALGGWALKVLAKQWVDEKVEYEINKIKLDNEEFKNGLNGTILKLIRENPQIKWASGTSDFRYFLGDGQLLNINNLIGPINWDSPITKVNIKAIKTDKDLSFKIVDKSPAGFTVKLLDYDSEKDNNMIQWSIIWITRTS